MSDDTALTEYLWPIVREIIKTAIENKQNLIVEGCYIPFTWQDDFDKEYLDHIKYNCLVLSENYISNHFDDIKKFATVIEKRIDDDCSIEGLLQDNSQVLMLCKKHNVNYVLIDDEYKINIDL